MPKITESGQMILEVFDNKTVIQSNNASQIFPIWKE